MASRRATSVEEYIAAAAPEARAGLFAMRKTIRKAAPDAEELISYNVPAFKDHGMLVYYAAFANHLGLYPTASGIRAFEGDLAAYKHSKGAVQFPLGEPLPLALVTKIVKFRLKENRARAKAKK